MSGGPGAVPLSGERGSVSIVAAGVMCVLLMLCLLLADVARVLVAQGRARSAADAAALAAAQDLALGSGDPPLSAADFATRNGSTLVTCACSPGTSEVTVEVSIDAGSLLVLGAISPVVARARAEVGESG